MMRNQDVCNIFPISVVTIKANTNKIYIQDLLYAEYCYTYHKDCLFDIHNNPM